MSNILLKVKPVSVNKCFQGRRFKTQDYKDYEELLLLMLPKIKIPEGKLKIVYTFGMSKLSDIDNPLKPLQDILQKKYGFNDRNVYKLEVEKVDVKKGEEFIKIEINPLQVVLTL